MNFKAVKMTSRDRNKSTTGIRSVRAKEYKITVKEDGSGFIDAIQYPLTAPIQIGRRFRIGSFDFMIKEDNS